MHCSLISGWIFLRIPLIRGFLLRSRVSFNPILHILSCLSIRFFLVFILLRWLLLIGISIRSSLGLSSLRSSACHYSSSLRLVLRYNIEFLVRNLSSNWMTLGISIWRTYSFILDPWVISLDFLIFLLGNNFCLWFHRCSSQGCIILSFLITC